MDQVKEKLAFIALVAVLSTAYGWVSYARQGEPEPLEQPVIQEVEAPVAEPVVDNPLPPAVPPTTQPVKALEPQPTKLPTSDPVPVEVKKPVDSIATDTKALEEKKALECAYATEVYQRRVREVDQEYQGYADQLKKNFAIAEARFKARLTDAIYLTSIGDPRGQVLESQIDQELEVFTQKTDEAIALITKTYQQEKSILERDKAIACS